MKRCLSLLAALAAALSASAEVRLPAVFSDHMVLQRDRSIPVWGWAGPGETVTVSLASARATAKADAQGRWSTALPALPAGGPFTLTAAGSSTQTRQDVLVGEVWLCSGQSNMEFGVKNDEDAAALIAGADKPGIRLFLIPKKSSAAPEQDVDASWAVCTPESVVQGGWGGFSAVAYHFASELQARLKVPVGLIESSWGGTRIEPWTPPEGFAAVPALAQLSARVQLGLPSSPEHRHALQKAIDDYEAWRQGARAALQAGAPPPPPVALPTALWTASGRQDPTALYNAMIHPLIPFSIRGAIWYQGESNASEGALYTEKMKALVGGWRQLWKQGDFPFLYVQIAPYKYGNSNPSMLPLFWEAQAAALQIPNTGMAVTNDVGNIGDIHPRNKTAVGHRLALLAFKQAYGDRNLVATGPVFRSMKIEGDRLRLSFDSVGGGLASRDGKPLTDFEIADAAHGDFVPAQAAIDGDTLLLSAPGVTRPVAMRFAWSKLAQPNFMNKEGLPASAFRAGDAPVLNGIDLPEARGFRLVYDLDLAKAGPKIAYDVDKHADIDGVVDRIAYYFELGDGHGHTRHLFVAMDPFTTDLAKIGVPTAESGARFQQKVKNLLVATNAPGIASGPRPEGNIEFWPFNYGKENSASVPGASSSAFDFGDSPASSGNYGSMQVHDFAAGQTLLAFNHWVAGTACDVGIGNAPAGNPDWTFAGNGAAYPVRRLRVLVHCR